MKIIVVTENSVGNNNSYPETLNTKEPVVLLKADSALLKDNKPFFVPDFTAHCSAGLHIVARVSRLGKGIPRRFAYRYFDALTVGLDIQADDVVERLAKSGQPWDMGESFDGGAVIGEFQPTENNASEEHEVKLYVDDKLISVNRTDLWLWNTDELIERMSRNMMLRQGDLLYCGRVDSRLKLEIGQHLRAELDGKVVLDFHIR